MSENSNPVGWFEIYVQDMERAKAFYGKTFETNFTNLEAGDLEMWAFPMEQGKAGCGGTLVHMPGKDSGGGGTIVYFECEDCSAEEKRAAQNGGKVERPKMSIGQYGFISLVLDPDGNRIGLHSME